jgi:hypothetical protein
MTGCPIAYFNPALGSWSVGSEGISAIWNQHRRFWIQWTGLCTGSVWIGSNPHRPFAIVRPRFDHTPSRVCFTKEPLQFYGINQPSPRGVSWVWGFIAPWPLDFLVMVRSVQIIRKSDKFIRKILFSVKINARTCLNYIKCILGPNWPISVSIIL